MRPGYAWRNLAEDALHDMSLPKAGGGLTLWSWECDRGGHHPQGWWMRPLAHQKYYLSANLVARLYNLPPEGIPLLLLCGKWRDRAWGSLSDLEYDFALRFLRLRLEQL